MMSTNNYLEPQEEGQLPVAMDTAIYATGGIQEVGNLVPCIRVSTAEPDDLGQADRPQDLVQANLFEEAGCLYDDFGELNRKHQALQNYHEEMMKKLTEEQKKNAALSWENMELKKKLGKSEDERDLYQDFLKRNTLLKSEVDEMKEINGNNRCVMALQEEQIKELDRVVRATTFQAEEEHKLALGFKKQSQEYKEKLDACAALYDLQQQKLKGMAKKIEKLNRERELLRPAARVLPVELSEQENRRFRIEQVNDQLRCTRCRKSPEEEESSCNFHPMTRWPYRVWKEEFPQEVEFGSEYFFWPCCQKFSMREPVGCKRMEEHQFS